METALVWAGIAAAAMLGIVGGYWIAIRLMLTEAPRANELFQVPTADGWTVRLCRYRRPDASGPPVILCHGIMANQFSLVQPRGDSIVDVLVERGFDCWAMDARGTRSSTPPPGGSRYDAKASDYALQDMPAVIDFVRTKTGYSTVHWIGHSMGGMMLYMYLLAFGSGAIASGTTLGSPPGLEHFKPQRTRALLFLAGLMPVVVEFVWRCGSVLFRAFKVNSPLVPTNWDNVDPRVGPAAFFNIVEFLPYPAAGELTGWIRDRRWTIADGKIDVGAQLSQMDAPLLLVYGSEDWFTPLDRAEALYNSLRSRSKRLLVLGREHGCLHEYSHVDLVFSPRGRTELYEAVAAWMEAHPARKGAGTSKHELVLEREAPRRTKAAPRPTEKARGRSRRRSGTARRGSDKSTPAKEAGAKKGGKRDVYATQKKVARKRRAAKKSAKSKPEASNTKKSRSKKKPAAKKKSAVKKKAAKKSTPQKPANRKTAAKKSAKKKPATRKTAAKPAKKSSTTKKKPSKRKR